MGSYKDLNVWRKAMDFCTAVYLATNQFPPSEEYGLKSQIRRAAVAIPSNIAEGQKRKYNTEFAQFIRISYGSGAELETQLLLAYRIGFLEESAYSSLDESLQDIMRMLNGLLRALQSTPNTESVRSVHNRQRNSINDKQ